MRRVLLLGADGLLGSCLEKEFRRDPKLEVLATSRKINSDLFFDYTPWGLLGILRLLKPDIVVNCIAAKSPDSSLFRMLKVNSLLPIQLAFFGRKEKFQVVHFSSNAVFSGRNKRNHEKTFPFPKSKYGFSKLLGEYSRFGNLVVRTSFVGSSPNRCINSGLVSQLQNLEPGADFVIFDNFIWNGVSTDVLTELISAFVRDGDFPEGIIHVFGKESITRLHLVEKLLKIIGRQDIKISVKPNRGSSNLSLATCKHNTGSNSWAKIASVQNLTVEHMIREMRMY